MWSNQNQWWQSDSKCTFDNNGAGIGSGLFSTDLNAFAKCGDITINGGTVIATGAKGAAGIGNGKQQNGLSYCGDITITGGTVTATGKNGGAGIGTGCNASNSAKKRCGRITITGGTVTATAVGELSASGIGTGHNGRCDNIVVTGGIVTATRSQDEDCYDIGFKYWSGSTTVEVDSSVRTSDGKGYTCVVTDRGYNQE